jgi:hypothetical protein
MRAGELVQIVLGTFSLIYFLRQSRGSHFGFGVLAFFRDSYGFVSPIGCLSPAREVNWQLLCSCVYSAGPVLQSSADFANTGFWQL